MYGTNFIFDGIKSEDMNLCIVSMNKTNFTEIQTMEKDKENISFDVELAYVDKAKNPLKIDSVIRRLIYSSLIKEDYKELILDDYDDVVFYAKFIPQSANITANGQGYFKFKIETDSSSAYSKYQEYEILNETEFEKEVMFSSYDNFNIDEMFPIIEFQIIDTNVENIYVKTRRNEIVFDFSQLKEYEPLQLGERIIVDCETHTIYQSNEDINVNRIRNWNCFFLDIQNFEYLTVSPKTKAVIKYRRKIVI